MSIQLIHITGMTCRGCVKSVKDSLEALPGVASAKVSLADGTALLEVGKTQPQMILQQALSEGYTINSAAKAEPREPSKFQQLRPLFTIFLGLLLATAVLNINYFDFHEAMLDFMGLFFLVFGFFKLIDLKRFPESFANYDPLAKVFPFYGWAYPFIELVLGSLLLLQVGLVPVFVIILLLLSITTIGVMRAVLGKKKMRCACLGTWLDLPMTEATLIENAIMITMAAYMFIKMVVL